VQRERGKGNDAGGRAPYFPALSLLRCGGGGSGFFVIYVCVHNFRASSFIAVAQRQARFFTRQLHFARAAFSTHAAPSA